MRTPRPRRKGSQLGSKRATRRSRVLDPESLYQLKDHPKDDDLEFVAHCPAIDIEEQAVSEGSDQEAKPSFAWEPEGKAIAMASREATPIPRRPAVSLTP